MKVWTVIHHYDYDGDIYFGIFSSYEKAKEVFDKYNGKRGGKYYSTMSLDIEERTVDQVYLPLNLEQ